MQFPLIYPKNIFWKTVDFIKNLEMTQIAGGGRGHVLCVICDSPLSIQPRLIKSK